MLSIWCAEYNMRKVPLSYLNAESKFVILGVANDVFEYKNKQYELYNPDDEDDNPRDKPSNWMHVVACVEGKVRRTAACQMIIYKHLVLLQQDVYPL